MNKTILLALLAGGIILLIFGIDAYNSADSDASRFFTGSPSDKSMGMIIGGVIAVVIGAGGLLRGPKIGRNS